MSNLRIKGILPALVTPLNEDRKTVNEAAARKLIDYHLSLGADGFYILGSTGEGLLLDEAERMHFCEIVVDQVKGRKPIICHTAAMNFGETIRLSKHAEKAGASAISSIPPLFFSYSNDDIFNYYKAVAQSTSLPFIMYNHSSANGGMTAETVKKVFEVDNVTGVKWTVNNYYEVMKLKEITNGEINIINGPDEMLIQGLSAGVDAGIGTTYNVMLPWFLKIYEAFNKGDNKTAACYQNKANKVIGIMLKHNVLTSVKYMCGMLGFEVGSPTYPLLSFNKEQAKALETELKDTEFMSEK